MDTSYVLDLSNSTAREVIMCSWTNSIDQIISSLLGSYWAHLSPYSLKFHYSGLMCCVVSWIKKKRPVGDKTSVQSFSLETERTGEIKLLTSGLNDKPFTCIKEAWSASPLFEIPFAQLRPFLLFYSALVLWPFTGYLTDNEPARNNDGEPWTQPPPKPMQKQASSSSKSKVNLLRVKCGNC